MKKSNEQAVVSKFPAERRDFLRKAVKAGFAVPAVATFSMSGLMAWPATAYANTSR